MLSVLSLPLLLVACSSGSPAMGPVPATPTAPPPSVTVEAQQDAGLTSPWGLVALADGQALVSERDTGRILEVSGDAANDFALVPEAAPDGEGGLLGLAIDPTQTWIYAYVTTDADNRVIRMRLDDPDGLREDIILGIPKAGFHNGGRIAFGPDGMLYVATGDAGEPDLAQDPQSLGGKILRIDPVGGVPADNPFPGSPVYSLGHRNVQGLAFDSSGWLWATEFGAKDADELNRIDAGANYGWPIVEGMAPPDATNLPERYVDPEAQWSPTSLASPSGIAIVNDVAYVASLRGEVLWQVPLVGDRAGEPIALDLGDLGRLRTIEAMPDGTLWLMTSNTDGRGDPRDGDDRIVILRIAA
ncbi:MAG: PQQ-dependent sugar dehydrogenase [Candidatus Nanopelagicales bacterium]